MRLRHLRRARPRTHPASHHSVARCRARARGRQAETGSIRGCSHRQGRQTTPKFVPACGIREDQKSRARVHATYHMRSRCSRVFFGSRARKIGRRTPPSSSARCCRTADRRTDRAAKQRGGVNRDHHRPFQAFGAVDRDDLYRIAFRVDASSPVDAPLRHSRVRSSRTS